MRRDPSRPRTPAGLLRIWRSESGPKQNLPQPRLLEQMVLDELQRREELEVLVLLLAEAVALVLREEVPHGPAVPLYRGDHLLGLGVRHARVVAALDDEHRLRDLAGVREGRDRKKQLAHLRIPLVAVLGAAQVAPVRFGVLEE